MAHFVPVSCCMFRSPQCMYETVDFSLISRPYPELWTHLEQCHYYGINISENPHKQLTSRRTWQTIWLISKTVAVMTSNDWALSKAHRWGEHSTTTAFFRSPCELRARAQMPQLAEVVSAQQSFQLRSVPKLMLTPTAMLSSSWKGRRSRPEETSHSERWESCGHSWFLAQLSFDRPPGWHISFRDMLLS